jgi:nucleoid-associated protein YgaU
VLPRARLPPGGPADPSQGVATLGQQIGFERDLGALVALARQAWAAADPALRPVLHVSQQGDNLADLAKKYLGDRSRWPEIRDLNVDVLGNHPLPAANPQPPPNTQLVILPP